MAKILVLHGPNLNLLGSREPEVYGSTTLAEIDQALVSEAEQLGHQLQTYQSNAEHELINRIHEAKSDGVSYILINPGAFTHTSIALRDAFLGTQLPFIEVHISNVFAREEFRQTSYLSDVAVGIISGLGAQGYKLALQAAHKQLN
jgi:3-dehydroquinate dehydratase-2